MRKRTRILGPRCKQECSELALRTARVGAAAAELALWLPFLALMFVVAVDFCRIFYVSQTLQNAAYAAALYASNQAAAADDVSKEVAAIDAALAEAVSLHPALERYSVQVNYAAGHAVASVKYEFARLVPWLGQSDRITLMRTCKVPMAPKLPGQ